MSDFITVAELRIEAERLCDENERLQAENDRLREVVSDGEESARLILEESRALEAENAKLRELVSGLHRCWGYESCDGCPMLDADGWCNRDNRLRELGIDVDGKTDATGAGLLPCPFCGGEARIVTAARESWALCDKCKASTEAHTSKQFAIAAWNRRAK